jgi:hypothetical protein
MIEWYRIENDLHHLFQRPATFNAFSTNREEWEDERMGLFGMGKGMGKNGTYGYRSKPFPCSLSLPEKE